MNKTIVEKVARVLCSGAGLNPDDREEFDVPIWCHYTEQAEAALDAAGIEELVAALTMIRQHYANDQSSLAGIIAREALTKARFEKEEEE